MRSCRARTTLLCSLATFAALQAVLNLLVEHGNLAFRDAEYERKRTLLHTRLAEAPGRPLILALGSSRMGVGFRSDMWPQPEEGPLVFNYSFLGAGPVRHLVCLKQLLRDGIRPAGCMIEVHPAFLGMHEENWIDVEPLDWQDMKVVGRYAARPRAIWQRWCRARLVAAHTFRSAVLKHLVPTWVAMADPRDAAWRDLAPSGWWQTYARFSLPEEEGRLAWVAGYDQYAHCLGDFKIAAGSERALRELLDTCRREGIATTMVTMPESSAFRSWYSPHACEAVHGLLTRLSQEYRVPWIDARAWVADADFLDGHHLLRRGARVFSARLERVMGQDDVAWMGGADAQPTP